MNQALQSVITDIEKINYSKLYLVKPVTETLTNGFFTVDNKWTVKFWNKAAEKILKVAAKDILGKNLWEVFAGAIPLEFYAVYHKAFDNNLPVHFEEYWGEMGAWFDVITYHCDENLSVSFKSSNHPYSEYPENPIERLKILTELYKFVTEITNDCLWEWDLHAKEIFWIDGGHKRAFGYQIENALVPQLFWESCLHPDDHKRVLAGLSKAIEEGTNTVWEDEYRFKKANGEYAYVHDKAHIIYEEGKVALRMIGATQNVTEKVLLEIKLKEERLKSQKEITGAVLTAQENERAIIGKELHDNLNQILAVSKMYIEMGKKNQEKRELYLETSVNYIMDVMDEIRRISKLLEAPNLVIGLISSIKNLIADINNTSPIKIEFMYEDINEDELNKKLQINIFRIIQEQFTNILKHANPSRVIVHLSNQANKVTLFISDNGNGSDTSAANQGVGIRNIISRAELYNGTARVISKPGKGYQLNVVMENPV